MNVSRSINLFTNSRRSAFQIFHGGNSTFINTFCYRFKSSLNITPFSWQARCLQVSVEGSLRDFNIQSKFWTKYKTTTRNFPNVSHAEKQPASSDNGERFCVSQPGKLLDTICEKLCAFQQCRGRYEGITMRFLAKKIKEKKSLKCQFIFQSSCIGYLVYFIGSIFFPNSKAFSLLCFKGYWVWPQRLPPMEFE